MIAGLMHPGDKPYSVAEYKNIAGRAGRLGFSERGTSYLLALDLREEHNAWHRYVKGSPEDLHSRFVVEDTDPRTLILRALAAARKASVKGIPATDVIDFLECSFGAFQKRLSADNWVWNRQEFARALSELEQHRLIEPGEGGHYHLTTLGRYAGESGIQVESIIRLVEVFVSLSATEITDPVLIAAAQLTLELDDVFFPLNRKSTQKEPQTWFSELGRQGIPASLLNSLRRFVKDGNSATMRAKKAAACLLWISTMPMAEVEAALTRHGGLNGAAGPTRSVASRTRDLLPIVVRVGNFLHPGLELDDRASRLAIRLELGVPAGAVAVGQYAGSRLTRGDYQELVKAGINNPEGIDAASDDRILACLNGSAEKVGLVREAAVLIRAEGLPAVGPLIPDYEA